MPKIGDYFLPLYEGPSKKAIVKNHPFNNAHLFAQQPPMSCDPRGDLNPYFYSVFGSPPTVDHEHQAARQSTAEKAERKGYHPLSDKVTFLLCLLSRRILWILFSCLPGNFALKKGADFWWIFSGLRLPRSEARKLLEKFGENSEQNSGTNSGRKFEKFGELSFCHFSDLRLSSKQATRKRKLCTLQQ